MPDNCISNKPVDDELKSQDIYARGIGTQTSSSQFRGNLLSGLNSNSDSPRNTHSAQSFNR